MNQILDPEFQRQFVSAISRAAQEMSEAVQRAAAVYKRPSVFLRPRLSIEGSRWCALYGAVAGFGDSPSAAMLDFDNNWTAPLK